jgi:uncharacterized protein (TIGR02996 family)
MARKKSNDGARKPTEAPTSLRQAFEDAITADPDERSGHMAYADWLMEQGDPRGEFIQVQLALEDPTLPAAEQKKLRQREKNLLAAHRDEWLGPLAAHFPKKQSRNRRIMNFARGWIDTLEIDSLNVDLAQALAQEPRIRLVQRLIVGGWTPEVMRPPDEPDAMEVLIASPYLTNVRYLQMGGSDVSD